MGKGDYSTVGRTARGYFGSIMWFKLGSDFNEVIDGDVKYRLVINLRKTYCIAIIAKVG
jgi:hypothetical protein